MHHYIGKQIQIQDELCPIYPNRGRSKKVYRNIHKSQRNTKFLIVLSINPGRNTNFSAIIHKSSEPPSFLLPIGKNQANLGKNILPVGKISANVGKNQYFHGLIFIFQFFPKSESMRFTLGQIYTN